MKNDNEFDYVCKWNHKFMRNFHHFASRVFNHNSFTLYLELDMSGMRFLSCF